jgi:glycosyltransferase involved in cell wall biosynthesis
MKTVSVAVITLNEEGNIEACLKGVTWADEIVVVDGGSTDATVRLAHKYTGSVFHSGFVDFAAQKNFALRHATKDWVLSLDADERVTEALKDEVLSIVRTNDADAVYEIRFQTYFFGKRLRFGGASNYGIRLYPRTRVRYEQPVHERIVTDLPARRLKNPILHHSTRDLGHYRSKLRCYIPLEIENMKRHHRRVHFWEIVLRPAAVFFRIAVIQGGILDGWTGLQFAGLSACYAFLKYRRYYQETHRPRKEEVRA